LIDFKRHKTVVNAEVQSIEYDPNRSSFVALIKYDDGELSYIIAPEGLKVRDKVCSGLDIDPNLGNAMPLNKIAVGTQVHNVEMKIGKGGQIARAAGCYATVASKSSGYVLLKMRSGQTRLVHAECYATIGVVSNLDHKNISLGKAGRSRWMGRRPSVRGVAMNPVDHPHGGGEGKTSGGRHPVSPWGKPTKGAKTRKRRKFGSKLVANIKGGN
jgi:large subunit ribosomal protein L2